MKNSNLAYEAYDSTFKSVKDLGGDVSRNIASLILPDVEAILTAMDFWKGELQNAADDSEIAITAKEQIDLMRRTLVSKGKLTAYFVKTQVHALEVSGVIDSNEDLKENTEFDTTEKKVVEVEKETPVLDMKGKPVSKQQAATVEQKKPKAVVETKTEVKTEETVETKVEEIPADTSTKILSIADIKANALQMFRDKKTDEEVMAYLNSFFTTGNFLTKKGKQSKAWPEKQIKNYFKDIKEYSYSEIVAPPVKEEPVVTVDEKEEVKAEETKVEETKEETVTTEEIAKFSNIINTAKSQIKESKLNPLALVNWWVAQLLNKTVEGYSVPDTTRDSLIVLYNTMFKSEMNETQASSIGDMVSKIEDAKKPVKLSDDDLNAAFQDVAKDLVFGNQSLAAAGMHLKKKYYAHVSNASLSDIVSKLKPIVEKLNPTYWAQYVANMKKYKDIKPVEGAIKSEDKPVTKAEGEEVGNPSTPSTAESTEKATDSATDTKEEGAIDAGNPTTTSETTSTENGGEKTTETVEETESKNVEESTLEVVGDTPAPTASENVENVAKEEVVETEKSTEPTVSSTDIISPFGILKKGTELDLLLDKSNDYKTIAELGKKMEELCKGGNYRDAMSIMHHYTITKNQIEDFQDKSYKDVLAFFETSFHKPSLEERKEKQVVAEEKKVVVVGEEDSPIDVILSAKDKGVFKTAIVDYLKTAEIVVKGKDGAEDSWALDKAKFSILLNALTDKNNKNKMSKHARRISNNNAGEVAKMLNGFYNAYKQA